MSTQKITPQSQSASTNHAVDANSPATTTEESPKDAQKDYAKKKHTTTFDTSNTGDESISNMDETLSIQKCTINTVEAAMPCDSENTVNENSKNDISPNINGLNNAKHQEAEARAPTGPIANSIKEALEAVSTSAKETTDKAVIEVHSHKADFCREAFEADTTSANELSNEAVVAEGYQKSDFCKEALKTASTSDKEVAVEVALAVDSQRADSCKKASESVCSSDKGVTDEAVSAVASQRADTCREALAAVSTSGKKVTAVVAIDSQKSDSCEETLGAAPTPAKEVTDKADVAADSQKVDCCGRPRTRSRTRSLSSAVSSLSGGESVGGDSGVAGVDPTFDNNGKTPLRANGRMSTSSHGPVRKRHTKKGRALFGMDSTEPMPLHEAVNATVAVSGEDTVLPTLELENNEGMPSPGVMFTNTRRSRSDTVESFRAAMDSSYDDLPTESIVLPERKDRVAMDSQYSSLPTESIVLPEMKNSGIKQEDDGDDEMNNVSNAKKVEDIIVFSKNNSNTPPLPLPSPGGLSNHNPLSSQRGRCRSDTIDFLTSAVEFQINDDDSDVEDVADIHPTPVNVTGLSNNGKESITGTTAERAGNDVHKQASLSKSEVVEEKISKPERSQAGDKDPNKGAAFGKTPKKTNLTRGRSQSVSDSPALHGLLRKRYRTRSLSFALVDQENSSKPLARPEGMEEGEPMAVKGGVARGGKKDEIFTGRRYRTRSLSFALSEQDNSSFKALTQPENSEGDDTPPAKGSAANGLAKREDDIATESDIGSVGRNRSDTLDSRGLDSIHAAVFGPGRTRSDTLEQCFEQQEQEGGAGRSRSDTLDFLTAAVAGDMGHDLDAAMAAAGDDGASFSMHQVSAPSGASVKYNNSHNRAPPAAAPPTHKRPRSNTLDSTTSSINSAKLDFLVSVAAEQGVLTSPIPVARAGRDPAESVADENCENSSDQQPQRRPRSNTLEIYSSMNSSSRTRGDTVDFLLGASSNEDDLVGTGRRRSDTVDFLGGNDEDDQVANIDDVVTLPENGDSENGSTHNGNVMDHLKALCDEPKISGSKTARILRRKRPSSTDLTGGLASPRCTKAEEGSGFAGVNKRARKSSEATWKTNLSQGDSFMASLARNRLESWGGMSDLSAGGAMGCSTAIAATHTALKDTGILDDVMAAAAELGDDDVSGVSELEGGGSGNGSLELARQIKVAASGASNSCGPAAPAAMATKTQQKAARPRLESAASASLGELSDSTPVSLAKPAPAAKPVSKETASVSTPSITVDYDAIAAAVNAANAATDGLDLAAILGTPTASKNSSDQKAKKAQQNKTTKRNPSRRLGAPLPKTYVPKQSTAKPVVGSFLQHQNKTPLKPPLVMSMKGPTKAIPQGQKVLETTTSRLNNPALKGRPFPVTSINIPFVPIPKCTKTEEELEAIRARARAAAGYVPPMKDGKTLQPPRKTTASAKFNTNLHPPYRPGASNHAPIKKMGTPQPPNGPPPGTAVMQDRIRSQQHGQTPLSYIKPSLPQTPLSYIKTNQPPGSRRGSSTLQSQQKWDDMFDCLVHFIEEIREKCTASLSDEEKARWIWDGNVPTSYKTQCGKALGRWINNQRSAKAKGTLKDDREVRLVSTGLKWSVLTTNSWRQMVRELEIYVNEQTKNGQVWDGNVPTNYKIKSNFPTLPGAEDEDDEKNLGRWVNRQRSLFQAGKLKKDRQRDLERIGLKWSVLLTTSWSTMFESLKVYAEEKRKASPHGTWDGNVPANFKTRTNPPLSLGRWVNRQRSARAKSRLKEEYVKKLEAVGLKWVIHVRTVRPIAVEEGGGAGEGGDEDAFEDDGDFEGREFIPRGSEGNGSNSAQRKSGDAVPPPALNSNGNATPSKGDGSNGEASASNVVPPPLPPLPPPVGNVASGVALKEE